MASLIFSETARAGAAVIPRFPGQRHQTKQPIFREPPMGCSIWGIPAARATARKAASRNKGINYVGGGKG
jgi:hypothetical protein